MKKLLIIIAIVSCLGAFASPEPRKRSLGLSSGRTSLRDDILPSRMSDSVLRRRPDVVYVDGSAEILEGKLESLVCFLEKKQPIAHASQSCVCVTKGSVNAFLYSELVQMKPIPRLCPNCFDERHRIAVDSVSLRVKRAQK